MLLFAHLSRPVCRGVAAVALASLPFCAPWAQSAADEAPATVASAAPFISGTHPDRRPEGAPVIKTDPEVIPQELKQRLHGIPQPIPGNVEEIAHTGQWFVPLRHPGMMPPYDIRHWHSEN